MARYISVMIAVGEPWVGPKQHEAVAKPAGLTAPKWLLPSAAFFTIFPVFLHVNGASVTAGQSELEWLRTPGATVSANSLAVAALTSLVMVVGFGLPKVPLKVVTPLLAFWSVHLLAFLFGRVGAENVSASNTGALFLFQTLLPTASFILWFKLGRRNLDRAVTVLMNTAVVVLGTVCLGLMIRTVLIGIDPWLGYQDSFGPLVISKSRRFFPTVVAIATTWAVLQLRARGTTKTAIHPGILAVFAVPMFGLLLIAHSRTAVLLLCVLSGWAVIRLAPQSSRAGIAGAVIAIGGLVMTVTLFTVDLGDSGLRSVERIVNFGEGQEDQDYNSGRIRDIAAGFTDGFTQPLGNQYVATQGQILGSSGTELQRVAVSENMYGEYASRAGPLGLWTFLVIVFQALAASGRLRALKIDNRNDLNNGQYLSPAVAAWLFPAIVTLVVLGGLTQLNATEFYVAPLTWALLGLGASSLSVSNSTTTSLDP